eukprot:GAHX01001683.1.p1 GENE.GAHX01001683.1~~GAHX01001683.1.p1  ORF type:complete len:584 (-),score=140.95 GAHX01001683.1:287-2038(-)
MQTSRLTFSEINRFLHLKEETESYNKELQKFHINASTPMKSKPHRKGFFNTPRSLYRADYLETESLVYSEMSPEELVSHINKIWSGECRTVKYQYNLMSEFQEKEFIAKIQKYLPKVEGGLGKRESTSYTIEKNLPMGLPIHTIKNPYLLFIKLTNNVMFGKLDEFSTFNSESESGNALNETNDEVSIESIISGLINIVKELVELKVPSTFKAITHSKYINTQSFQKLELKTRSQIITKIWNTLPTSKKDKFRDCCKVVKSKLETDFETMLVKKSGGVSLLNDQDVDKENELEQYINNIISKNKRRYNYSQFLLPKKPRNEFVIFYTVFCKMAKNKDNIEKISLPLLEEHIKNTLEKFKTKKQDRIGEGKKIKIGISTNTPKPTQIFKQLHNHIKHVSKIWGNMTEQEKRPYKIMASHEQCNYKESLQTYFLYFMDEHTLNEIVDSPKKIRFKTPYSLFKESNKVSGEKHSWSTTSTKIKLGYITSYLINKRIKIRKHILEQEERDKNERAGIIQEYINSLSREDCNEFLEELELNNLKAVIEESNMESKELFELDRVELLRREFNDVYEIERYTTILKIIRS